ncbi:hypothetical protein pipiens_002461 [Culex pipiens pipiens]|uniref:Cytochrome P450 n=1 Tax=Culex pipiens pipiens TaxID=38569 RepID=A0ABD1DFY6_CULPP
MSDYCKMVYDKFEGVKVFGLFDTTQRIFVLRNPELIKKVAVKDFDYFVDRQPWIGDGAKDYSDLIVSKMLLGMKDQKWRDMRATLSPAFTGSKMRAMFDLITEYTDRMVQIVRSEAMWNGSYGPGDEGFLCADRE